MKASLCRRVLVLCTAAIVATLWPAAQAGGAANPQHPVQKMGESRVDDAATIAGRWGDFINGKSYQQDALTSFNGWQYATYYDRARRLALARRRLPNGTWEVIRFDDYIQRKDDNHNVAVVGICPNDGTIHLAFDHHSDELHYRVSHAGVATAPERVRWRSDIFGPVRNHLHGGKAEERVTYPRFVTKPDGNLIFIRRHGSTRDGRIWFAEYAPSRGGWSASWQVTDSIGSYAHAGRVSTSRNAYLNGVHFADASGRLHLSWTWRENLQPDAHVGLAYACSDDGGRSWRNTAGTIIGGAGRLLGIDSPGVMVRTLGPGRGLEIQQGQWVDGLGRPHLAVWHLREREPDLVRDESRRGGTVSASVTDAARSRYHHYWRDERGRWRDSELPHPVDASEANRPKIVTTRRHDVVYLFNHEGNVVIFGATAASGYTDWRLLHREPGPWAGEVLPDPHRWRSEEILSIYLQRKPAIAGQPTALCVLDFTVQQVSR